MSENTADSSVPTEYGGIETIKTSKRRGRALWIGLGTLAVLLCAYVGVAFAVSGKVPPGAAVAGIKIGSMSESEARSALDEALTPRAEESFKVSLGDKTATLKPAEASLRFDLDKTLQPLTGFSLLPQNIWRHFSGMGEAQVATDYNKNTLESKLKDLAKELSQEAQNASIEFTGLEPKVVPGAIGNELEVNQAAQKVAKDWLTVTAAIELPGKVTKPQISDEAAELALKTQATPLVSGPLTVKIGDKQNSISPEQLVAAAAFKPDGKVLKLDFDRPKLIEAVQAAIPDIEQAPQDARYDFSTGTLVLVNAKPGLTFNPEGTVEAVTEAVTKTVPEERVAEIVADETEPAVTDAKLQEMGIKEIVAEFSTPLTNEPIRTRNLIKGAGIVTSVLIKPGDEFSLNNTLGPIDGAHGWNPAMTIQNGFHKPAYGGGLCQLSTTIYNAAFMAGMDIVERHPHSEYFTRYPEGRDAAIWEGHLDMRFKNTTPYGVMLQSWVGDGRIFVRAWSTKYYEVKTYNSGRSGVNYPVTRYSQSPDCAPSGAGNPGFTVTTVRERWLNGQKQDQQSWVSSYQAAHRMVCGPPPGSEPAPAPATDPAPTLPTQ